MQAAGRGPAQGVGGGQGMGRPRRPPPHQRPGRSPPHQRPGRSPPHQRPGRSPTHQKPAALACSPRLRVSSPRRSRLPLPPDPHPRPPKPTPRQGFAIGATEAYVSNAAFALENLPRTLAINHSTDACGANRKTLQGYFDSVYPLASVPAKKCLEGKSPAKDLWFFFIHSTCPPCDEVESSSGFRDTVFRSPMCMPSHYMAYIDRAETRAAVEMLKALSHHTLPAAHDPPTGGLPEMQYTIVRNALAGRSDIEKGATMNSDAV